MPKYWLISDRNNGGTGTGPNNNGVSYFTSDHGPLDQISNWTPVSPTEFQRLLKTAADQFPELQPGEQENQSHVSILLHGYNNSFKDATERYENFHQRLFDGPDSIGLCILYDWPSLGNVAGYLPDRANARQCAEDFADILSTLFDWLLKKQADSQTAAIAESKGRTTTTTPCKAKVSVIAHSMGNYLLQKAMHSAWTRKNKPLLVSLINQLIMIAADVDNDLFDAGAADFQDGEAITNLTYRITALYSGRDAVLGASAGIKHFGTRRLGRSGLAYSPPLTADNVWDVDCSSFFPTTTNGLDIHGAYFVTDGTIKLIRQILKGTDRGVLEKLGTTKGNAWPA